MIWAVHISDGILLPAWLVGGFVAAVGLVWFGAWRIRDEEIPQVALMTAAFFVVSLIHVPAPATSVHLICNGLLGVMLGRRACLAIPLGLFLQAIIVHHGGISALGVNSCVMVLPALLAWAAFGALQPLSWTRQPWCLFPLGMLIGAGTVFVTAALNALVLLWGGQEDWRTLAVFVFLSHLPVAVIEGIVLGFTMSFLVRVKPALLGWESTEDSKCVVESLR